MISVQVHWPKKTWRWLFAWPWREGSWVLSPWAEFPRFGHQAAGTLKDSQDTTELTCLLYFRTSFNLATLPWQLSKTMKRADCSEGFWQYPNNLLPSGQWRPHKSKKSATGCHFVIRTHSSMYVKLPQAGRQAGRHSTTSLGIRLQDRKKKFVFIQCVCTRVFEISSTHSDR